MDHFRSIRRKGPDAARRRFVQGLAAGGALAAIGLPRGTRANTLTSASMPTLSGTEFDLVIDELPVNYTGAPRTAIAVNGTVPAPTLRWR